MSGNTESAPATPAETQSSLQDGFSRFDETAHRLAEEAASNAGYPGDDGQGYMHQGLDNISRAGSAVAGAIRQRPFVSLAAAALGGALLALSRRA